MLLQATLSQTDKQRLYTALIVGSGIQSHNATRSFSHSPYALLLLVVQHQVFVPMNLKSIAAGPRDKKVVEERRDVFSGFVCEGNVLRNLLLNIGAIHQVEPCHIVVQPSQSGCKVLIDHHVILIVLLVRETPFIAKSHALRTRFTVRIS